MNSDSDDGGRRHSSIESSDLFKINEVLSEAFYMSSHNSLMLSNSPSMHGSSGYSVVGHEPDLVSQSSLDQMSLAGMQPSSTSIQKLYQNYKQLELRVSDLEEVVYGATSLPNFDQGTKRAHSAEAYTVRSISPTDSANSNPSSTCRKRHEITRKDDLKRTDLDDYCMPVLIHQPKPSNEELYTLVRRTHPFFPNLSSKHLLSKIREWFRKRREYMSQRIFQACEDYFSDRNIAAEEDLGLVIAEVASDPEVIKAVLLKSDLEINDVQAAESFCYEKILSYISNSHRSNKLKSGPGQYM